MYPFVRLPWQFLRHRNDPPLPLTGTHVSRHICWPWDLDVFAELNNGRTLTFYDLGRLPLARRTGTWATLRRMGWGMTIAGSSLRYRRRVRAFDRLEMRSRILCWDARFIYSEQAMWRSDGACTSHGLFRSAITDRNGIVTPDRLLDAMGHAGVTSPETPDWVAAWIAAEASRPWPPMADAGRDESDARAA